MYFNLKLPDLCKYASIGELKKSDPRSQANEIYKHENVYKQDECKRDQHVTAYIS